MGCTRSHSKTLVRFAVGTALFICLSLPNNVWAAFASQFSLSAGEQYNDNIFFSKQKEQDFVTVISPTLSLFYAPEGQVEPTGNLSITSNGRIYARHADLNNFGQDTSVSGGYLYRYSPRLSFNLTDTLYRQGPARLGGLAPGFQAPGLPTTSAPVVGTSSQNLKDLISNGTQLSNGVSLQGSFLYRPDISFTGGYTNTFVRFIDLGGTDVFHTANVRGVYNWRQDHNLHAGYTISIARPRNGDNTTIHNFDFGDDYFSNYTLQLTPTLSLSASTGLSFNTGGGGPSVANNTNITITKLWERASVAGGLRKGLTPTFGVAGISDTTTLFTDFTMRVTEKLTATSNVNFSLYDTKDVNFKTFQAGAGLQYAINSWLSTGLNYYFNWVDSGAGASSTDVLSKGVVNSHSVFLSLTSRFDLWPNVGLARGISALTPVLKTPFPTPAPVTAPTGTP